MRAEETDRETGRPLHEERLAAASAPTRFLWSSFKALIPTLIFDVGGTMLVYYLLLPHFPKTSILPLLGASLVPLVSNVVNFVRRRSVDIVGIIVLVGLLAGVAGAMFGGGQRILLVRESFITGLVGLVLIVSPFLMRKPLGYYVIREFLTANETLPAERFQILWNAAFFRRGVRIGTILWGALLLGEFALRVFMALSMNIVFVLAASPFIFTIIMLAAGAVSAVLLSRAIHITFSA